MARTRERTEAAGEVTIEHDPISEGHLIAAALVGTDEFRTPLVAKFEPDHFFDPKHRLIWVALKELERQHLGLDLPTLQSLGDIDANYCETLISQNPVWPANIDFHVNRMQWDYARITAAKGPLNELVQAVNDPLAGPDKVKALLRQLGETFDGYKHKDYLRNADELVREIEADVTDALEGRAIYAYGIPKLDVYETLGPNGEVIPRMIPGTAPGMITCVTGLSGMGKSTVIARMVLAMARKRRKVLYGAWEMTSFGTLELLACMACKFPRQRLKMVRGQGGLTDEELALLLLKAKQISEYVIFMDIPFNRKKGEKFKTNDANLDIMQEHIAKVAPAVFVADLFKRCLVNTKPDEEELALGRVQSMAIETKCHMILAQQQRLKDIEKRVDKRPTREGIKGSSIWVDVADTIIGIHRPFQWKQIEDNILELDILKQRYGKWPMAIEFDWDPETAEIGGGRTVPYDAMGDDGGTMEDFFKKQKERGKH